MNKMNTFESCEVIEALQRLREMRRSLLEDLAMTISSPRQTINQKTNGVWRWNAGVVFPAIEKMRVTDDGCLVFKLCGLEAVEFSIWVTFGEVRVGVLMPERYVPIKAQLKEKLHNAYDGKPCQRLYESGGITVIDWIFKEGFACMSFMEAMVEDNLKKAIFIDKLNGIVTHLYMAFSNLLMSEDSSGRSFQYKNEFTKTVVGKFEGDIESIKEWLKGRSEVQSISQIEDKDSIDGDGVFMIRMHVPTSAIPLPGAYRDQDSGMFTILSIDEVSKGGDDEL